MTSTSNLRPAILLLLILTLVTGVVYPGLVTGIAHVAFRDAAQGSLILRNGVPVASRLVGQSFTDPGHFWSRPSATAAYPYNGAASGGSNQGPLNPALTDAVTQRIAALRAADPGNMAAVPVDLVTASASGLDPHLSIAGIQYQVARVARARNLAESAVRALVQQHVEGQFLGFIGEPRVNVVELNLALEDLQPADAR